MRLSRRSVLAATGTAVLAPSLVSTRAAALPDRLVVTGTSSGLAGFDLETGALEWSYEQLTGSIGRPTPIVADGTVYIGGSVGAVHAVDAASGEQKWTFDSFPGSVETSPTVIDGVVYAGSGHSWEQQEGPNVFAIDAASGEEVWKREMGAVWSSPQVVDGVMYISEFARPERLVALDADTGQILWELNDGREWVQSSPLVVQDRVFIGTAGGELLAVDRETGAVLWSYEQDETIRSSPVVANETVYFTDRVRSLYAVDAVSGSERWSTVPKPDFHDRTYQPTLADGTVYLGSRDYLFAVDAETGENEWYYSPGMYANIWDSPTVVDDYVLFVVAGTLFAVSTSEGEQLWDTDDLEVAPVTAPTVTDDPHNGHSIDSRVLQGTLGHHHDTAFAEQPLDTGSDGLGAGLGFAGAVAGISAGAYLSWRRQRADQ